MGVTNSDVESGTVIADKYRVLRQLGEGGMGSVYLVQHLKTDERFALKILHAAVVDSSNTRERFRREARTPARIDSDHVARVVDTDVAADLGELPFLVMEYLKGKNLEELSNELGPLPPSEVLVYLKQVALALDKAHSLGIVHRDLKPENLFLTTRDDGTPCIKVLDFGIAKLSGATGDLARVKATQTGEIFGTPMYMSPEQCLSETDKVSGQSDIWALGLIAHRLLTGADFWTANTITHLIAQIAYEEIPAASERGATFGPAYDDWLWRCCSRTPSKRFASANEAVDTLSQALGLPSQARMPAAMRALDRVSLSPADESGEFAPQISNERALGRTAPALTRSSGDLGKEQRSARRNRSLGYAAGGTVIAALIFATFVWLKPADEPEATPAASAETTSGVAHDDATTPPATQSATATASTTALASASASSSAAPAATNTPIRTTPPPTQVKPPPTQVKPPPVTKPTVTKTPPKPPPTSDDPLDRRH